MMEAIIYGLNESRFWLFPGLLGCVMVMLAATFVEIFRGIQAEMDG